MTNLAVLAVCLILGVLLRRLGRLPEEAPKALNGFVLNVALPALVVRHLQGLALDGHLALAALMPWALFAVRRGVLRPARPAPPGGRARPPAG